MIRLNSVIPSPPYLCFSLLLLVCLFVFYTTSSLPLKSAASFASTTNGNVIRRRKNIVFWIAIVDFAEKCQERDWLVFLITLVGEGGGGEGGFSIIATAKTQPTK